MTRQTTTPISALQTSYIDESGSRQPAYTANDFAAGEVEIYGNHLVADFYSTEGTGINFEVRGGQIYLYAMAGDPECPDDVHEIILSATESQRLVRAASHMLQGKTEAAVKSVRAQPDYRAFFIKLLSVAHRINQLCGQEEQRLHADKLMTQHTEEMLRALVDQISATSILSEQACTDALSQPLAFDGTSAEEIIIRMSELQERAQEAEPLLPGLIIAAHELQTRLASAGIKGFKPVPRRALRMRA